MIPMLNLVLCLVVYTCFAFYCISAVLRDRMLVCCSVLTATVINDDDDDCRFVKGITQDASTALNEHYYYMTSTHCTKKVIKRQQNFVIVQILQKHRQQTEQL